MPQADYDAVIQATRGEQSSAQLAPAIDQLRAWHLANPEDMRFLYDLAALLDRAGDYPAALLHYPQIVKADAPPYAIKAVAHAAKMANRPQQAEAAYQLLVNKTPEDREAHVGLVYAWIEQKRLHQAFDYASRQLPDTIEKYSAADVPMMVALAELHELRKDVGAGRRRLSKSLAIQSCISLCPARTRFRIESSRHALPCQTICRS